MNKGHEIHYYQCQTPSTQSEDPREVTSEELEIDDYDEGDNYGRWENSSSEISSNEPLEIFHDDEVITTAYTYSRKDLLQLYLSNIKLKQVIANQLITRGGSRCTNACDEENYHVHTYCTQCKKNLFYKTIVHDCNWGLEEGQVHPEMNSKALVNHPWWREPLQVQQFNNFIHLYFLQRMLNGLPFYEEPNTELTIAKLD